MYPLVVTYIAFGNVMLRDKINLQSHIKQKSIQNVCFCFGQWVSDNNLQKHCD